MCKLSIQSQGMKNIDSKIEAASELLSNLEKHYKQTDTATKRLIVSSIFPSWLIFDKNKVRTLQLNEVLSLLFSIDKGSNDPKKRSHTKLGVPSLGVESTDQISNSFIEELQTLANLKRHL